MGARRGGDRRRARAGVGAAALADLCGHAGSGQGAGRHGGRPPHAGGPRVLRPGTLLRGLREATGHAALGVAAGVLLGALVGVVVARYRSIFFAMLTLAFSMVLYGVLIKAYTVTGGSDGMPIPLPTLLGLPVPADRAGAIVYDVTIGCVALAVYVIARYLASPLGFLMRAIRDNEVRVQYLGGSVRRAIYRTYVLAAGLAALGGVLGAF